MSTTPGPPAVPPVPAPPSGPPAPPPGPGVVPPFAAPPTEGRTTRLWLGLAAAGLFVVLCCGGGIAAITGLGIFGMQAIDERARVAVTDYIEALERADYRGAYALLCDSRQRQQTEAEFVMLESMAPRIESYRIHKVEATTTITVPVDVTYSTGAAESLQFILEQDTGTGDFEVCGVTD